MQWRAEQFKDDYYDLFDPDGRVVQYGQPIEEVEYYLAGIERVDEYVRVDLGGVEETIRLR